ncbi:hypothetical protein [Streptomyces purpureus]|uniref:Uncharacterized protein n=1 Tax=Streptomyces purpureus TaxID=1951 RepID=A0A918HFW3_9ACTN|nr:hypothetical protein [Streptomyces purpureus]GGT61140.1 hypothetical protein GCM10014713_63160 [Streptomyces purpureus]
MQQARGRRSVAVGRDAGVVVTGDHNHLTLAPPPVRSAYAEQVRRIAPPELIGRERELAELAAFCLAGSGPSYAWWRAGAWAGKTALMAWFALHPPKGVRVVPFFITARLGMQNDVVAYVDVVLEQLAEIVGEGLPALLTAATREAHLLRLYGEAAEACARRGERLVLLVDGLDEDRGVTTGPDAHSIASLLPTALRTIVAGRLNPPLPGDVPHDHPLRAPDTVRALEPSPHARAIRAEAERELKRLLGAGGLAYDLLALLAAAGGGLTADDLAELTDAVPYHVRDILRTGPGRTFATRGEAYLLAHEELQVQAREMLGERELARLRGRLHTWAADWRERGWPPATPEYLLRGYFSLLRSDGDLERMTACALDAVRHDRLLEATGGDAVALGELRDTGERAIARGATDLRLLLRLAMKREELRHRNGAVPGALPVAWAALGRTARAEALARSLSRLSERHLALIGVADELVRQGAHRRAFALLRETEEQVRRAGGPGLREEGLVSIGTIVARAGQYRWALTARRGLRSREAHARVMYEIARSMVRGGHRDEAVKLARDVEPELRAVVLAGVAELLRPESPAQARELFDEAQAAAVETTDPVEAATALAEAGEPDRAALLVPLITKRHLRDKAWEVIALSIARGGDPDRAVRLIQGEICVGDAQEYALAALAGLLVASGERERGEALAASLAGTPAEEAAQAYEAEGQAQAGDFDTAFGLADLIDDIDVRIHTLIMVGRTLGEAGQESRAHEVLTHAEYVARSELSPVGVDDVDPVAESLADTGHTADALALMEATYVPPEQRLTWSVSRWDAHCWIRVLTAAGQVERAAGLLDLCAGRDPWPSAALALAKGFVRAGEPGRAEALVGQATTPEHEVSVRTGVAELLVEAGEYARARRLVRACAHVHGRIAGLAAVVLALRADGRDEEADEVLGEALDEAGELLRTDRRVAGELVPALVEAGAYGVDAPVVIDALDRLRAAPCAADEVQTVAAAFTAVGDWEEARKVVVGCSGVHEVADRLVWLAGEQAAAGRFEEAERVALSLILAGDEDAAGRAFAAVAFHAPPAAARVFLGRALMAGWWGNALPELFRAEPGTVPMVVAALRRARQI